ncbi:iron-siderophore ABC transporter substrate-binding protein [Nocardioides perillae]|uniref:Iron complex transport system substrate-binding protein n=1 Tax=Nocardioides perillae TaxID=1119534 RepID=A0A7Y9RWJ7_9ACTN|nr:iron-siderophore ABC transporter substrate-binding protein [Nocardioides perillae]NYG56716.1 iron complex transport system substrate-binding protein [Nocardioides perillae]
MRTPPRPSLRRALLPAALLLSVAGLAACGTSQPAADAEPTSPDASAGPVSLTDAAGRTVELDAPAERVVVLEWQQVEDVLALGVEPVGVADVAGYNTYSSALPVDEGTTDVGTRGEPNMDAVFSTDPDLVIVEAERGAPIIDQLTEYDVPVLVTKGADTADPIANMEATFTLIAEALGKEEEAEEVLAELDATIEEGKAAIAEADLETTEFVYVDGYVDGSNVSVRPFGQGSLMGELGETLGLTNVWSGKVDPAYGLGATDPEGLRAVGDAHFFYSSTEASAWVEALEGNAVWQRAGFVQADRVHPFPEGVWTFGGPRSSQQVVEAYVDALT